MRLLDRTRDHLGLERLVVLHAQAFHHPGQPVRGEPAHEVVFEGDEEPRGARVALAARAPSQLVVDAARLVALGADHMEAARVLDAGAELDVRAAAGHVRCDGDRTRLPGAGDDRRLALVLLRVEDLVLDPGLLQFG